VGAAALLAAAPARAQEPVQPIAPAKVTNPAKVELGKKLWFDPRLSRSGFISCNSCHNLSMGGSDNLKTSIGDKWQKGPINSPTVLNSSLNLAQFWDGRAKDLKEQAGGPIANPGEMAFSHDLAVDMLRSIPQYVGEFKKVFGHDKLGIGEVTAAIAAFGLVPMLFASGPGSEVQRPLAIVVIGGLITSTALTLVLLPVLFRRFGVDQTVRFGAGKGFPHD